MFNNYVYITTSVTNFFITEDLEDLSVLSEDLEVTCCDIGVQFNELTPMTGDVFNMTDCF